MTHSGLLNWANSVRLTMANDPGRQAFRDQVQTLGFLFLDDYLDNILSGAKQDPLIELVKTPGRKKVVSKKFSSKRSKLNLVEAEAEENIPPFQIRDEVSNGRSPVKLEERGESKSQRSALRPIQSHGHSPTFLPERSDPPLQLPPDLTSSRPPMNEHNELSVIAEDEEPFERTQISTSDREIDFFSNPPIANVSPVNRFSNAASTSDMDTNTFHTIPLNSPSGAKGGGISMEVTDTMDVDTDVDRLTEQKMSKVDLTTNQVQEDTTNQFSRLGEKKLFPSLPEPLPFQKSTRIRDPSVNGGNGIVLGAVTPGAASGKRTSWLAKAREVKALEGNGKKYINSSQSASIPITPSTLTLGMKRKSGELSAGDVGVDSEERLPKVAKVTQGEVASREIKDNSSLHTLQIRESEENRVHVTDDTIISQDGVLDMLKKTVEGLGLRAGKTMGKSLGNDAATVLAEAKAAAEARLAERDRHEGSLLPLVQAESKNQMVEVPSPMPVPQEGRVSISDLFPRDGRVREKNRAPEKVFHKANPLPPPVAMRSTEAVRLGTSTTPLTSPPFVNSAAGPVFTKLAPVFVPPIQKLASISTEALGSVVPLHHVPSSMVMGFGTKLPSPARKVLSSLTAQSTVDSVQSDTIFDCEETAAWMPSTQDTDHTTPAGSQSQPPTQICDEDDSWPIDDKLEAGVQWSYGVSKDDSMTWSTLPSQSQCADTGHVTRVPLVDEDGTENESNLPNGQDMQKYNEDDLIPRDKELDEAVLGSVMTVNLVKQPELTRSQSQSSIAASESSQSHTGFFGQASKLLSSALGTGKKKPEVKKVLQMAAVAAKKQQEEADKKALRLKEMEMRRQQALQRKAEEEKAKTMEEERKMREEAERRRREKEDQTFKQPFKPIASKREDDSKKRKVDSSPEKQTDLRKPPSVLLGKSHLKSAMKAPSSTTTQLNTMTPIGHMEHSSQPVIATTPFKKAKTQIPLKSVVEDFTQPSQVVQSKMAARAKAQIEASKPTIASESIELPDINSEYSDSEDEDRPRTYDPPDWAQSPELRQALEHQSTINPDDIFGAVRPLKMEEIFKMKSRFRARSSSANWTGSDRLTAQEELEYARRMGFK